LSKYAAMKAEYRFCSFICKPHKFSWLSMHGFPTVSIWQTEN